MTKLSSQDLQARLPCAVVRTDIETEGAAVYRAIFLVLAENGDYAKATELIERANELGVDTLEYVRNVVRA